MWFLLFHWFIAHDVYLAPFDIKSHQRVSLKAQLFSNYFLRFFRSSASWLLLVLAYLFGIFPVVVLLIWVSGLSHLFTQPVIYPSEAIPQSWISFHQFAFCPLFYILIATEILKSFPQAAFSINWLLRYFLIPISWSIHLCSQFL